MEIEFPNGLTAFNETFLNNSNNRNDLIKAIKAVTGNEVMISIKDGKAKAREVQERKTPMQDLGIDINIID